MYKHEFTPAPEGYTTKKGALWVKKKAAAQDSTTRNKPKQAPVCLMPMPEEGVKLRRYQKDAIFAEGWADLTKDEEVKVDESRVGLCGDMSSIMGIVKQKTQQQFAREALSSPAKKLNLRDLGWCKPFIIEEEVMDDNKLNEELEKVGHKCHLRYKHFRTCMRKLDYDHSGEVDLQEFITFFGTEFNVPVKTSTAIFNMLNTQGAPSADEPAGHPEADPVLDYNELMVVLGPYINPGAPPPIQMKASNTTSGSVHGLHLRKLG